MAVTAPIRDKKQVKKLAEYWLKQGNLRNYTLIVFGVCSALRISDLLQLTWGDVYNHERCEFRSHITLTEKKTGKNKIIALNKQVIKALHMYFPFKHGEYIFTNNRKNENAISRVQAWRIIRTAAESMKTVETIACHSLRKTFGYHAWKSGTSTALLMDIYNHTSYEVTRRYLGISQDDRDAVYLNMTLF